MSYLIFDDESKAYWTDRRKPLSAEYKYESQFLMQRTLWNSSLIPALGYEWMLPGLKEKPKSGIVYHVPTDVALAFDQRNFTVTIYQPGEISIEPLKPARNSGNISTESRIFRDGEDMRTVLMWIERKVNIKECPAPYPQEKWFGVEGDYIITITKIEPK